MRRLCALIAGTAAHDDDLPAPPAAVELTIDGAADGQPTLTHYRVDQDHRCSHESASRTFLARISGVNGFCRKFIPASSTP
jgi:hypothetical protein